MMIFQIIFSGKNKQDCEILNFRETKENIVFILSYFVTYRSDQSM